MGWAGRSGGGRAMAAAEEGRVPVVDVHAHTSFGEKPAPIFGGAYSREDYLKQREAAGIVASVSMEMWKDDRSPDLRSRHVIHCAGVGERALAELGALHARGKLNRTMTMRDALEAFRGRCREPNAISLLETLLAP